MENRLGKETRLAASRSLISSGLSWGFLLLMALIFTAPLEALGNRKQQQVKQLCARGAGGARPSVRGIFIGIFLYIGYIFLYISVFITRPGHALPSGAGAVPLSPTLHHLVPCLGVQTCPSHVIHQCKTDGKVFPEGKAPGSSMSWVTRS